MFSQDPGDQKNLLMAILLALALTAAGRIWGLDARLRHRLPGWIA